MILALLLAVHIAAGGAGLLSGAGALVFRKGGQLHRLTGKVAATSLLIMTATAIWLGVEGAFGIGASLGAALAFYLSATGWLTMRRRAPGVGAGEYAGLGLGLCVGIAYLVLLAMTPAEQMGMAAPPLLFGAGLAGMGAGFDLSLVLRRGISGKGRVARHVWRVCVPFFMANAFFFLAQPDIFAGVPMWLLAMPPAAVVMLMAAWMVRVRFGSPMRFHLLHPTADKATTSP